MQMSEKGIDFLVREEGFVSKAYRDVTGTWTIGTGFTNGSKVAVAMLGPIKKGLTITRATNDAVLAEAMATEYGPPVNAALPHASQHEFDAGGSYTFNCGRGAAKDRWFRLLASGQVKAAAKALRGSRTTSKGRPLAALANRRKREAKLMEFGDYGNVTFARSTKTAKAPAKPDEVLRGYQQKLLELGYYHGTVDGWHGPKTESAVLEFQKTRADLVDDGILGPATRAAIDRDIKAKAAVVPNLTTAGIGGAGAVKGAEAAGYDWSVAYVLGAVVAVAVVAYLVIRYRTEIMAWLRARSWFGSLARLATRSKTILFGVLALVSAGAIELFDVLNMVDFEQYIPENWLPSVSAFFGAIMIWMRLRTTRLFGWGSSSQEVKPDEEDVLDYEPSDTDEDEPEVVAKPDPEPATGEATMMFYIVKKKSKVDYYAKGGKGWTKDLAQAMRFARHEDAERFRDTTFGKKAGHEVLAYEEVA